jgi:DNA polymerase (family 10)
MPCGSFRRDCATMGDIDLVILDGSDVASDLLELGLSLTEDGYPRREFSLAVPWLKAAGLKVDLWTPADGMVGSCIVHATGSGLHNVLMRRFGYARGLKFTWAGVQDSDGKFIAGETEASCFEALGWPMMPPTLREEVLDWALPLVKDL